MTEQLSRFSPEKDVYSEVISRLHNGLRVCSDTIDH